MSFIKDVDRELLSYVSDEELLKVCSINKYFWYGVCDDAFLRRRMLSKYPNIEKYKKDESWKRFFVRANFCISKLLEKYNYKYVSGDFETQHYIFQKNTKKRGKIIEDAGIYGVIELVIHCIENENGYLKYIDESLRYASQNGFYEIVKYLVQNGAYHHESLNLASSNGHLEIVKFLVEKNLENNIERALLYACESGHFRVVEYLVKSGADINFGNELALKTAIRSGYLEIVKFLVKNGANVHNIRLCDPLELARNSDDPEIEKYILSIRYSFS